MIKQKKSEKEVIDEQIAKFIYATNSSFRVIKHEEFICMIQLLRPCYHPPGRLDICGKLLNNVLKKCPESSNRMIEDKTVRMSLDGWSFALLLSVLFQLGLFS